MISEQIEEDARRLDEIIADLNRQAADHKRARDEFQEKAAVLADKRDRLQKRARSLASEAALYKERRDEANITARECRAKRDEWNDRVARMRASGGLGDVGEAKMQSNQWHQKAEKASRSSDAAHEKMHQLYEEADRLRAEAQVCHQQSLDCRKAADVEHTRYIEAVRRIERVRNDLPERSEHLYLEARHDVEGLRFQQAVVRRDAVPADDHSGLGIGGAGDHRIGQDAHVGGDAAELYRIVSSEESEELGASEGALPDDPASADPRDLSNPPVQHPSLRSVDAVLHREHYPLPREEVVLAVGVHGDEHVVPCAYVLLHAGAYRALYGCGR